jgi:hypothetical protein
MDLKCSACNCVLAPDSTRCPNCGLDYAAPGSAGVPRIKCDLAVGKISYVVDCMYHGRIVIKAKVADQPKHCPFC